MQKREEVLAYGLGLPNVYVDTPFHDQNWVLLRRRENKKAFAWTYEREGHLWVNVKVDPEWRDFWRSTYEAVIPGYHQNKLHWNSIRLDGSVPDADIRRMIAESYDLVGKKPPRSVRKEKTMTKEKLALEMIERLKKEYPEVGCTLDYDQAWKLLVSVRLAAQCTDARVNVVVQDLYEKYPDVDALAEAEVEDIEKIVKPCGLGHSKARDISACMKILRDQYGGKVPDQFEALLKLPGVGRKSANLIMGDVFGKPAIVTDTHCIRLVNRMGLVKDCKDPKKVEMELWKLIPPEEGSDFCHRLVFHGRDVCTARTKPFCDRCCLGDICEKHGL